MSFIILILIVIMLYAALSRYGSIYKVLFMSVFLAGMTSAFLFYGKHVFEKSEVFVILNTEMNMTVFMHACLIWYAADIFVVYKIIKNYKTYTSVNSIQLNTPGQGQG